ncbi:hypothetical protein RFI_37735 [Reticulomyxa filosa]|uniref:Uncharacterized protein n=1 Tax=Reticulomyxa filosa TaxID=46433 RepID=X6LF23_RETFI|nr:hypothetical protein RFI_37735 [Reticulomyxa filosa]|eukprot:ETN99731.1 hypothetical protein RFI_37735 [Reticulomyxa filosa]
MLLDEIWYLLDDLFPHMDNDNMCALLKDYGQIMEYVACLKINQRLSIDQHKGDTTGTETTQRWVAFAHAIHDFVKGQSKRQYKQGVSKKKKKSLDMWSEHEPKLEMESESKSEDGVINAMIVRANEVWGKININEYLEQQIFHN